MKTSLFALGGMALVLLGAGCTSTEGEQARLDDLIWVEQPRMNAIVSSPLTVEGEARGTWYFEASFPVKLVGEDGDVIFESFIMTSEDWMTEDYVPFSKTFTFDAEPQDATLILMKDNPSGLPENDASLEIPVTID